MNKESCGAVLYTFDKEHKQIYFVLGLEYVENDNVFFWCPFKGERNIGESRESAAARELAEETIGLVKVNSIKPLIEFGFTGTKRYLMGLHQVPSDFQSKFRELRKSDNLKPEETEKLDVGYFTYDEIVDENNDFPFVTRRSVEMIAKYIPKNYRKHLHGLGLPQYLAITTAKLRDGQRSQLARSKIL